MGELNFLKKASKHSHFYFYKTIFETHLFNMNMKYLSAFCLTAALSLGLNPQAKAQGESDPGFSTIGAMRTGANLQFSEGEFEFQKTQFSISNTFAKGERDVKLFIPQAEVIAPLRDMGYFDVKLPIVAATGELAHVFGLGDLTATYTQVINNSYHPDWTVQLTGGAMFGMGTASESDGATRPLPMVYQSNLGSTDVIVGGNVSWKNWVMAAIAYQQPIFRYNENNYDRSAIGNDLLYSQSDYQISRKLYRYGDVMFRLEGHYGGKRAGISAGPLFIYHLRNDMYTDRMGYLNEIDGSKGLTVNLSGNAFVRLGRKGQVKLDVTGGFPIAHRDATPDGLSRQWMFMPRFTYFFKQENLLFRNF